MLNKSDVEMELQRLEAEIRKINEEIKPQLGRLTELSRQTAALRSYLTPEIRNECAKPTHQITHLLIRIFDKTSRPMKVSELLDEAIKMGYTPGKSPMGSIRGTLSARPYFRTVARGLWVLDRTKLEAANEAL